VSKCTTAISSDAPAQELERRAVALGKSLGIPFVRADCTDYPVLLVVTPCRLELRETGQRKTGAVFSEFVSGRLGKRGKTAGASERMLARAVGFKRAPLTVCDATAGLGRDAFLLACLGCKVTAIERSPVMAALLADGLERATTEVDLAVIIRDRLRLVVGDARTVLAAMSEDERPDVVYLDPMFPAKRKSAAAKKEMRICRLVAGDDADAEELFAVAVRTARSRVVVKRPLRAPPLGARPAFTYKGTTIRYDVYLPARW